MASFWSYRGVCQIRVVKERIRMKDLRLDKFLTEMGKGSRSQVKTYISKGRVTVNGEIIKRPEYKISPENDIVNLERCV